MLLKGLTALKTHRKTCMVRCSFNKATSYSPRARCLAIKETFPVLVLFFLSDNVNVSSYLYIYTWFSIGLSQRFTDFTYFLPLFIIRFLRYSNFPFIVILINRTCFFIYFCLCCSLKCRKTRYGLLSHTLNSFFFIQTKQMVRLSFSFYFSLT